MNDEHEHAATHAERWLENIRPPAWSVPGDLLGGAGGWVEVVRLDELREAVRKHSTPPEVQPFREGECAPAPGCGCLCHRPGGMAVSHFAPCCNEPPFPPGKEGV